MKNLAPKKLNIIIVNYNSGEHLKKCLESIRSIEDEVNVVTWVVDNNSKDDSIKLAKSAFPKAFYILNKDNLGFGKANNQVLEKIKDGYILLLNPDALLPKNTINLLLDDLENDISVGAVTCQIVFENGQTDLTAHRGFPTPWASFLYFLGNGSLYHLSKRDMNSVHEVDAISGAFFLTSKEILDKVGFFDEDYFMYAEDIDLCYRIKKAGFKILYDPRVKVLHYKGVSSGLKKHSQHLTSANKETRLRSLNYFYETMKIFYQKHLERNYPFFINWLVYLAIDLKWMLARRKLEV